MALLHTTIIPPLPHTRDSPTRGHGHRLTAAACCARCSCLWRCRDGLIAVNYAARAAGITRHMRVAEARQKCPQLQLVHVATIG